MAQAAKALLLVAFFLESSAIRRRSHKQTESDAVAGGEPGEVDFILTFGAPGPGSPAVQNQRGSDPCFPGVRIYHAAESMWTRDGYVDVVPRVTNLAYYWHSWMPVVRISMTDHSMVSMPCNNESAHEPTGVTLPSVDMHTQEDYIDSIDRVFQNPYYTNVSTFAATTSYLQDPDHAYEVVQQHGWGLVGSALDEGANVYGGRQVSHLMQRPSTNECVLTFQGTASFQDWIHNLDIPTEHFCGLVDEDETCGEWSTCQTRHPRGSFVHGGFKARLLAMVQTDGFQKNILPYLPKCSKVAVAGHSLGGAVAELFAACASKAPQPGQYGYDDYKHMAWTKGMPGRLAYIGQA